MGDKSSNPPSYLLNILKSFCHREERPDRLIKEATQVTTGASGFQQTGSFLLGGLGDGLKERETL